jgi:glycerol-1-phosphate dehydrogenase [NAD(P)+]
MQSPDEIAGMEAQLLDRALRAARDTRLLVVRAGVRHEAAEAFGSLFGSQPAVIVADERTFAAAGRDVHDGFRRAGLRTAEPFVFGPHVYAEYGCVDELRTALKATAPEAVPVAVGAGTLNDLTKLVAHQLGRPYMVVATAASMDGYTAFGASITYRGSKQTFDCPAPRGVLADLEVIGHAPEGMNASGYADLLAKGVAGADWIVADALGAEPIDPAAWETVQRFLRSWVGAPASIARNEPGALRHLVQGLMMSGFAMQATRSSRPASGAEHQFSHLWDMQHHVHQGAAPSHGFKVGIGTLASLALYDVLLQHDFDRLDIDEALGQWPSLDAVEARIDRLFEPGELADKAREETRAKYPAPELLRAQLDRLRSGWPALRARLHEHLIPHGEVRGMLAEAGCPAEPEAIGISRPRLRHSYEQAYHIRRRFTVLDLAERTGTLAPALDRLFGPGAAWES